MPTLINDKSRYFVTAEEIMKPTEARERFRKHFLAAPIEEHGKQWSSLWDDGDFLPWDKLCASPALEDLLAEKHNIPEFKAHTTKKALVPGCGRGYDALLFSKHGYDTVGVEISGSAVKEAKRWINSEIARGIKDGSINKNKLAPCEIVLTDFFDDEWLKMLDVAPRGGFELVYDYAFLVAMNPSMREAWAKRMAELITPGTGLLICLEYPLFRAPETGGPPHGIKSTDYDRLLRGKFEKIMHYRPGRTHKVGEGSDMVSVWRRKEQAKL
ncbi:S-adenosyl-L-methionine-dependent methyltransferase [Geopyxis carbonaria]|nr:S-adenosyl-L-methionine-dependent methyltransferase [Geopyxis carbonaria]